MIRQWQRIEIRAKGQEEEINTNSGGTTETRSTWKKDMGLARHLHARIE